VYRGYFIFSKQLFSSSSELQCMKTMKYQPQGSVLFVTFSLEEGLLLLSNPLCLAIIQSCLARAKALHPVRLSHILVQANHVHLVLVVINPDDIPGFIRCFKVESAHMLNRLLGRAKRTVWCEGYDSPLVLTPVRALCAIAYLYANPAKDNLIESIDDFPGFSSWHMFRSGNLCARWKRLRRYQCRRLPPSAHNLRGYSEEAFRLLSESREEQKFELEPDAWLEAFGYRTQDEKERLNERLVTRIRALEARAAAKRSRVSSAVMGRIRLETRTLDVSYRSQRSGQRSWCLSEKRRARVEFIKSLKAHMAEARVVRQLWMKGDTSRLYPPGLHPPSMPKLANSLTISKAFKPPR
jgi:REP element-mobilizing transposase RayT